MNREEFNRLALEQSLKPETLNQSWLDEAEIDQEVANLIAKFGQQVFYAYLEKTANVRRAITFTTLDVFAIGFDCGQEFGKKTDLSGIDPT